MGICWNRLYQWNKLYAMGYCILDIINSDYCTYLIYCTLTRELILNKLTCDHSLLLFFVSVFRVNLNQSCSGNNHIKDISYLWMAHHHIFIYCGESYIMSIFTYISFFCLSLFILPIILWLLSKATVLPSYTYYKMYNHEHHLIPLGSCDDR